MVSYGTSTYAAKSPRRLVWIDFQAPDLVTWVQIPTRASFLGEEASFLPITGGALFEIALIGRCLVEGTEPSG